MFPFILSVILIDYVYSLVLFRNPSSLTKISAGMNESVRIAWTVEPRDTTYLRSHLLFRKSDQSCIIMSFDQDSYVNFSNKFQSEISSMGPTFVTLNVTSILLEGVLVSVENLYKDSAEVIRVEVFDFLPIYIVRPPEINCDEIQVTHDSLVSFECFIGSKPEPFINIGFQKIPLKYDVEKQLVEKSELYYKVTIRVSFKMSALYLGKKIYVSASTGNFDTLYELTIPTQTIPFNVQLLFDELTTPFISIKPYSNLVGNIYLRCSASSHDKAIVYFIYGPNKFKVANETYIIEKFDETRHVGDWYCLAKNKYGEVTSTNIKVSLQKGVPERPTIAVQNGEAKDNVFAVNSKISFTVMCYSGSFPEIKMYHLQMVNSVSEHNVLFSKTGKFVLNYDRRFTENIYLCKAENVLGISLPIIFHINDSYNSGWSKHKSPFLQSSFIIVICILTVFLLIMVLYIAIKLKKSPDARQLLWRIMMCKFCAAKFSNWRHPVLRGYTECVNEELDLRLDNDRFSIPENNSSEIELQYLSNKNHEVSGDEKEEEDE